MAKEEQIKTSIELTGEKEYRAACSSINTSLREINSEMKLATAEFANNASSSEALTRKQEVLQKQLAEQAKKAEAAEAALRKMREAGIDPTNTAFQKMQTNLNNTKAEMLKTEQQINGITESLNKTTPASEQFTAAAANIDKQLGLLASEMKLVSAEYEDNAGSAEALKAKLSVLQKTYSEQEKKVQSLEKALNAAKSEYGENSDEAMELEKRLNECKAEMKSTGTQVKKTSDALDSSSGSWAKFGEAAGKAGKAIGAACAAMGAKIAAAGEAFFGLAKETREARENMGKLETSFTTAGHSAEDAKNTYTELYGVLGDDGQATEAAAHLAKLTTNEKELSDWTNICTGVYATFGDSLPIEGLTEAANETAKTGAITGNLADALNWAGVSEDDFQAKLDACTSEQERQALITSTLNGLYSEAANKYREVNGDIIDAQKATANLNNAMAELGAIAEPIITRLKQLAAELLQQITPFVALIGEGLAGALSGAEGAAQQFTDGLMGMVTLAIEKLTEMLPKFLEFAVQMIANIATGITQSFPTLIPSLVQLVVDVVQVLIDNIPMLIDVALQLITGLAQGVINAIPVLVAALPQLITSLIDGLLSAIPQIIQAGIDLLVSLVAALPEIITAIVEAIPQIINGIVTALMENIPLIIQAGIDLLVALIQALPEIIVTIVQAIPQIISGIVNALIGNIDQIIMAGANLLHGLWEGISSAASWLWDKVTGWARGLVDGIKGFFGIHSPSTVFAEIGTNMGEGVGVGFGESMDGVSSDMTAAMGGAGQLTAAEAVRSVNDGIIANIEGLSGAVNAIVERVITGLTAQAQKLNQAGQDFDKNIASGMIAAIPQITSKIPQIVQSIITAFTAQHQKFISEGENFDKKIAEGMVKGIPQITGKVSQIVQLVITALRSFISDFTAAGEDMVRGIWTGFQNMSGWLESRVRSMMRSIVAAVQSEMQINSPSKVFAGIGEFMAMGLGEGFAAEMRNVESTIRRETANAVPERDTGAGQRTDRRAAPTVEVVQNIYANETSYAKQQREAARQFRQIAREVMA